MALIVGYAKDSLADVNQKVVDFTRAAAASQGVHHAPNSKAEFDSGLAQFGRQFFETKALSNSNDIACRDCHLAEFGSSDGLPVSVGVGGSGTGPARVSGGGEIIPRNSLPLWARGEPNFKAFFWDGRVQDTGDILVSQFGEALPSSDPLVVAVHLPVVEIREMMIENEIIASVKTESTSTAEIAYQSIVDNLIDKEPELMRSFALYLRKSHLYNISFLDIAKSIAAFIRQDFAIPETRFSNFVNGEDTLSDVEVEGAYLFFGKGKCVVCHSGPYFSNFNFYAIGFPQLGFGRNGFGVDYGRYNVTHDPADLYKFRVPPLWNVDNTGPYGHSGSVATLTAAITHHYDPLRYFDPSAIDRHERIEYYKVMLSAADAMSTVPQLTDREAEKITSFLKTLSFSNTQ
jgi:cytochrome c peroxidase